MPAEEVVVQKKSVLVVDDEKDIRDLVKDAILMSFPDARIVEAENGSDAYLKAGRQKFDLVISDINMPKRTGIQFMQALQTLQEKLKPNATLIFSGQVTEDHCREVLGSVRYLAKPCPLDTLRETIRTMLTPPAAVPVKGPAHIDVTILNPFINGAFTVLAGACQMPVTKDKIFVRKPGHQATGDISATVAVNSAKVQGSFAITFEKSSFLAIATKMMGKKYNELTPEASDVAGEICSQIFGQAREALNASGYDLQAAVPSIVTGPGHEIRHFADGPVIAVQLKTEAGLVTVEVCVAARVANSKTVM